MFSSKKQLIKKSGKHGVDRFSYLEQLVKEYNLTKSQDAKEQVLANLANFAYDPINYDYLWRLKILDLFFGALEETNKKLVSFAAGGICNICLEPRSREYILRHNGVQIISNLLTHSEESVVLSAITILIYLNKPHSKYDEALSKNVELMLEYSKSSNRRIKNLANIFLEEICNITVTTESTESINFANEKLIEVANNDYQESIVSTSTNIQESNLSTITNNQEYIVSTSTNNQESIASTSSNNQESITSNTSTNNQKSNEIINYESLESIPSTSTSYKCYKSRIDSKHKYQQLRKF